MAIAKGRLEVWKPQIRIVDTVGGLGGLLEPAVWVACDTYEDVSLNIRRGNALESFNYSDKVFEPTVASFRLTNRPHNFKGLDLDYYAHTYKDSDGTTIPIASSFYDSGSPPGAYYGLTSGQVRLRQRWGVFTNFFYEFQHVRLVDAATHLVLFQGRITKISKKYEDGNGSVVTIDARDALDQIANISTSNLVKKATFSTSQRRSDLIKYILNLSFNYAATVPATGPESADDSPAVAELNSTDGTGAMVTTDASAGVGENTYKRFEQSATVFPRETIWNAVDTGSKHALSEIGRWALLDPHASTTTENVFGYDFFVDPNYGKYNLNATKGPGVAGWNSPQFNYFKRGNRLSAAGSSSQDAGVYGLTVKYPTITTARRQGARYYNIGTTAESALAATTTFLVQNGHQIRPGYVIQIGSEHMYVLAVYPDDEGVSTNDEIAVIRGFSATDAADFNSNVTISYPRPAQTIMQASFNFEDTKEDLATEAVVTYNTKKDSKAASGSGEEKERLKQKRLEIMYVTEVAAGTSPNNTTPFHWDGRNMDTDFENPTFANAAETLHVYNAAGAKQADDVARIQYQSHATLTGSTNFAYILLSDIGLIPDGDPFPTANYGSDTYVELRGSTSGAKCRLNLAAGLTAAHEGHPSKVWGVHRVIDMGVLNNDDPTDLRKEVAARLAQATTGLRQGSYSFSKAPYYWWEGQVLNVANHADGQTIEVANLNDSTAVKVTNFGIRAGMLVHKMVNATFNVMSTVEVPEDSGIYKDVYGYISSMTDDDTFVVDLTESQTFAADDYIKIVIPIKAGTEVFVDNVIADIYGEHIITEVSFSEDPVPQTRLSSIGKNESRISGGQKVRGFVPAIAQAVFTTREQVNASRLQPVGTQFAFLSVTVPDGGVAATRVKATWSIGYLKLLDGRVYQFLAGTTAEGTYGLGADMAVGTSYIVYLDPEGENTGPSGNYHLYTKAASDYIQDADNFPVFHVEVSANVDATSPSMRLQPGIIFDHPLPKVDANLVLENSSVITALIDDLAITNAQLQDLSVNGRVVVHETLVEHHYSEGSVTSNILTNGILNGKTFVNTGLEIDSGGYVRTKDKESLTDTTAGFWLGRVGVGVYGLAIGGEFKYLTWDGTNLAIKGTVTIDDGELAGLTLAANKMYFGTGTHKHDNTPFYVDSAGNFSLGELFSWTASTKIVEVKSSATGARVELTGTGLVMYDSSDAESASMKEGSVLKATGGIFKSNATVARSGSAGTGISNTGVIIDDVGIIGGALGVTQFFIRADDGKAYFGGGACTIDSTGINFPNAANNTNGGVITWNYGGNYTWLYRSGSSKIMQMHHNGSSPSEGAMWISGMDWHVGVAGSGDYYHSTTSLAPLYGGSSTDAQSLHTHGNLGAGTGDIEGVNITAGLHLSGDVNTTSGTHIQTINHLEAGGSWHLPALGGSGQLLVYGGASGTAAWQTWWWW